MPPEIASLDDSRKLLWELALQYGPKLLTVLLLLAVGLFMARWVGRTSERGLQRLGLEPPVQLLLSRLARVVVMVLFVIMALQNLGVDLLPLIAGLSVAGAGVALATQGVLSNVVAGLTIIFTRPYRVGEYISIIGVEGRVEAITLFSTALTHADRSVIVVPNRKVVGEVLHNYGRIRQAALTVGVAYEADLIQALHVVAEQVRANTRVLADPAPLVQVSALGESAVFITINPWVAVADYGAIEGELNLAIVTALQRQGIVIPYPQRQVHLIGSGAVR